MPNYILDSNGIEQEINIEPQEVLVCKKCGHVNIISNIPFKRRITRNRQIPLDDAVYNRLKNISSDFKNINQGLQYFFHQYDLLKAKNGDDI